MMVRQPDRGIAASYTEPCRTAFLVNLAVLSVDSAEILQAMHHVKHASPLQSGGILQDRAPSYSVKSRPNVKSRGFTICYAQRT